jgi:regulator of nucleoside diphosphate kinase
LTGLAGQPRRIEEVALKKRKGRMILLTQNAKTRLEHLLESARRFMRPEPAHLNELQEALDAAEAIAPEKIPGDVVTVYSTVCITDLDTRDQKVFTLVFPREANYSENRISVLAPLGAALLGYRPGDIVKTQVPGGERRLKVEEVSCGLGQPTAA